MTGAKIPKYWIIPIFKKCRKCPVCFKAIRSKQNKKGICSVDGQRENTLNYKNQKWKREKK